MEISNNVNLNSIDKAYNVFTKDTNQIAKTNDEKIKEEKLINNDINFNYNKINETEKVNQDVNSLLSSIKSSIENGANTDIFNSSRINNISDLLN
ncbi:MAG: hypothetical protein MJ245_04110 [Clostridia bacterium]|nr:hypothetical protein [Clostridia bacterium]